jgi:FKBP-type peptidyl-prolyl cis-trans isomerase
MTSTQGRHARSMKSHLCSSLINNNNNNNNNTIEMTSTDSNKRRQIIEGSIVALTSASLGFLASSSSALAAAADKPAEFLNVGTQAPPPEGSNPFVTLENGVKVKDIKLGKGEEAVTPNSRVDIQCSGRLLNLNGVSFYNTKNNNPDGFGAIPLSIDLGKGQAIPGLESGLVGMKKSGVRRIIGKFS